MIKKLCKIVLSALENGDEKTLLSLIAVILAATLLLAALAPVLHH